MDYKQMLGEAEFARFAAMRAARKRIADSDAVPAFAVFTDAELAELAKIETLTPREMLGVRGIGEKRVEKYGRMLCQMLKEQSFAEEETKS